MKVYYEWTIEIIDDDEIVDVDFSDTLNFNLDTNQRIGLRRYTGNNWQGVCDIEYIYADDNNLPRFFESGKKIPYRYHQEYKNWITKTYKNEKSY